MAPRTRKGPKGIVWPKLFLPNKIKVSATTAPLINDNINAKMAFGNPSPNPIKAPNLTSPPPIPLPLVNIMITRKNPPIPKATNIVVIKSWIW